MPDHNAIQYGDQLQCHLCGKAWDVNDPEPPLCVAGPGIATADGGYHEFAKPFRVCLRTAAGALSHINRFTGHAGAYSVARHSVLVAQQLPKELRLAGLLHDVPEAYLGGVSAPLKALIGPKYRELERVYHDVVDRQFRVKTRHPLVCEADIRMLVTEGRSFGLSLDRFPDVEPYGFLLDAVRDGDANTARLEFLDMCREEGVRL